MLKAWKFPAGEQAEGPWGSGYPADPVTKKFLQSQFHPVFGFPSLVRFSWKTAEKIIEEKGIKVLIISQLNATHGYGSYSS